MGQAHSSVGLTNKQEGHSAPNCAAKNGGQMVAAPAGRRHRHGGGWGGSGGLRRGWRTAGRADGMTVKVAGFFWSVPEVELPTPGITSDLKAAHSFSDSGDCLAQVVAALC